MNKTLKHLVLGEDVAEHLIEGVVPCGLSGGIERDMSLHVVEEGGAELGELLLRNTAVVVSLSHLAEDGLDGWLVGVVAQKSDVLRDERDNARGVEGEWS